jgi:hypothetical protein
MWKECKCVLIPADNSAILEPISPRRMEMRMNNIKSDRHRACHLHIISDEHINNNDWCYSEVDKCVYQENNSERANACNYIWKVLAATDTLLIVPVPYITGRVGIDNVLPQIPESFLLLYIQEYNKGNIITNVTVEYEDVCCDIRVNGGLHSPDCCHNSIIQLKVNPKDNTINIKLPKKNYTREEYINNMYLLLEDCFLDIRNNIDKVKLVDKSTYCKQIVDSWTKINL